MPEGNVKRVVKRRDRPSVIFRFIYGDIRVFFFFVCLWIISYSNHVNRMFMRLFDIFVVCFLGPTDAPGIGRQVKKS